MNETRFRKAERALARNGYLAGAAAGSWIIDGNTTAAEAAKWLASQTGEDDTILCSLPSNPLSGEWADDPTEADVLAEAGVRLVAAREGFESDQLLDAYENGFRQGVLEEVLRAAAVVLGCEWPPSKSSSGIADAQRTREWANRFVREWYPDRPAAPAGPTEIRRDQALGDVEPQAEPAGPAPTSTELGFDPVRAHEAGIGEPAASGPKWDVLDLEENGEPVGTAFGIGEADALVNFARDVEAEGACVQWDAHRQRIVLSTDVATLGVRPAGDEADAAGREIGYGGPGCSCRMYDDGDPENGPHLAVDADPECPIHGRAADPAGWDEAS